MAREPCAACAACGKRPKTKVCAPVVLVEPDAAPLVDLRTVQTVIYCIGCAMQRGVGTTVVIAVAAGKPGGQYGRDGGRSETRT